MKKVQLSKLRKNYNSGELNETNLSNNPFTQFEIWLNEALLHEFFEANAMILSTISKNNKPSSRVVLLKYFSENGLIFFTNYNSRKGKEIENNNNVSLVFYWPATERQVRIEGTIAKTTAKISDEYFYSRPIESQASAVSSKQSAVIKSSEILKNKFDKILKNGNIKRPLNWGGFIVKPVMFEFWQGRLNRLHDRITFCLDNNKWKIVRLSP